MSSNGQLTYGILFEEDTFFPWDEEEFGGDIDEWWLKVSGFKPSFYPYTEHGGYKEGLDWEHEKVQKYYEEREAFEKKNPLEFELDNYCSCDYPMYILSNKGTSCSRGYPEVIEPSFLEIKDEKEKLIQFCKKFGIEYEGEPKWYLSSYYG